MPAGDRQVPGLPGARGAPERDGDEVSDVEKELRDMLRNKADEVLIETDFPSKVLKRSRRRRAMNAALAGVAERAGRAPAGSSGASALLDTTPTTVPGAAGATAPPPPAGPWRGLWPQDTRAEAEAAQAEVDAGSIDSTGSSTRSRCCTATARRSRVWERTFFITEPLGEPEAKAIPSGAAPSSRARLRAARASSRSSPSSSCSARATASCGSSPPTSRATPARVVAAAATRPRHTRSAPCRTSWTAASRARASTST